MASRDSLADGASHHILATSSFADERSRVLKHGDTFAVFDHYGRIKPGGLGEEGLYHEGTRFLSRLLLELEDDPLIFLGSTVRDENDQLAIALTNPDLIEDGNVRLPLGTLHLAVRTFLWQRRLLPAGAGQEPWAARCGDLAFGAVRRRLRRHLRDPRHEAEGPGNGPGGRGHRGPRGARLSRPGRSGAADGGCNSRPGRRGSLPRRRG